MPDASILDSENEGISNEEPHDNTEENNENASEKIDKSNSDTNNFNKKVINYDNSSESKTRQIPIPFVIRLYS
jgi:hypothetical protein